MLKRKYFRTLSFLAVCSVVVSPLASGCGNSSASSSDNECDTVDTSDISYYTDDESVSYEEVISEEVPNFAGDWESSNSKFGLTLSLTQNGGSINVDLCQIYRVYAWQPTARIENGKLILDDPDSDFPFHAEFELKDGKLIGQCRAKGDLKNATFNGTLTMKPEDKDNALDKLLGNGGTYRYSETHVADYYGEKVNVTYGLEIGLQGGPQIATYKYFAQENYDGSGYYETDGYNITINIDDGTVIIPGHFSKNMSMLYLNFNGQTIALRRIGDFNYDW